MRSVVLCAVIVACVSSDVTRYNGYKVYEVTPQTDEQALRLAPLVDKEGYDFWSDLRKQGFITTVMVDPDNQATFESILKENNIDYTIKISDVEEIIESDRRSRKGRNTPLGRISFSEYHEYDHIQAYLTQLANSYPDIVKLEPLGTSTEGRVISAIRISSNGTGKPLILVDAGIHAREWIAPATALYIIQELVENATNRYLIENVDWYIIPVLNPDGYQFTHTNTRLWRKTRAPGSVCVGVDGNRNFDFHWMETGASDEECSEIYAGSVAFSEPETVALSEFVLTNADSIKLYLTFHSYGNYLLYPWGYTSALPDDWETLDDLAQDVAAAIYAVDGTSYTIGSSTNVLYAAAGGSDDWVKGVGGVNLSYTIELPGGGSFGFDLPANRIASTVYETFEGIKVYHSYIEQRYGRRRSP